MRTIIFYLITLILLTMGCWLVAFLYWGSLYPGEMFVVTILCWLLASTLLMTVRRISARIRIYAGLLILALMFLPTYIIVQIFPHGLANVPFDTSMAFTLFVLLSLAMIIAAYLLYTFLNLYADWMGVGGLDDRDSGPQRDIAGRTAVIVLLLCIIIIAKAIHYLYWLMVWDTTYDSLGYLWLFVPVLAVLFAAIMLVITLPGMTKLAGLVYVMLIPAMILTSIYARRVNFRQLTESRAGDVSQAIEAYYARIGSYPQDLHQLTPLYIRSLPDPVIIYGQEWCYDSGDDYYRFGYVDREHWSNPHLIGRIYKTKGEVPALQRVCEEEANALLERYPNSFWTLGE